MTSTDLIQRRQEEANVLQLSTEVSILDLMMLNLNDNVYSITEQYKHHNALVL